MGLKPDPKVSCLFGNYAIHVLVTASGMMRLAAVAMLYVNDGKLIRVGRQKTTSCDRRCESLLELLIAYCFFHRPCQG